MVNKWETHIVSSDWHIPYHDKKAVEIFLYVTKQLQPEVITIDGDMLDFYKLSNFTKDPTSKYSLQVEIDTAYEYLERLRKENPKATIYFVDGNHEFRLSKFLMDKAPELYGLRSAKSSTPIHSLEGLLCFDELNIKRISSESKEAYFWYGESLQIGHYNKVNGYSAYTAKNLVEKRNISLIQGHTHRLGASYKTVKKRNSHEIMVGYENGCLCQLDPPYMLDPNWQQGFSIIKKKRNRNRFMVQQIPIIDYICFYGGIEFNYDEIKKGKRVSLSSVRGQDKQKKGGKVRKR